ncbi:MAG TPA: thiolase family protein [Planctomycetota bacterium]|nr:thiolase family protein [Planctomycetota bacterium]
MTHATSNGGEGGRSAVYLGGLRTPFCKAGTDLEDVHASELGRVPAEELLLRLGVRPEEIDEVIFGNVAQPIDSANIARVIALRTGIPVETPALTVHRNCASGLEAITIACERIRQGEADLILAGGVESMSSIPLVFHKRAARKFFSLARSRSALARVGALARFRPSDFRPVIGLEKGLTDPVCGLNMGETAETLAREFGIRREEQDRFALESHHRALRARESGFFGEEIVSLYAPPTYAPVAEDVGPRKGQSLEALAKLRPYFDRRHGTVTVGNSCPVTDGGVAVLLASEEKARELSLRPRARILSWAYRGCPPHRMGLGPVFAAPVALDRAGLRLSDIDRIELNEAFAAQVIACERAFASREFAERELGRSEAVGELDPARLNVNGGAIALGHPVGATGARLVLTLVHELERSGLSKGLATLCVGGGQGGALVLERCA